MKAASLVAVAVFAVSSQAMAGDMVSDGFDYDIAAGEALYKKDCRGCHGPTAKGLASYPKLRGQTADYLMDKLQRYRAGEKFGPNTPLMAPRAKKLSDEDIVNIAHFIASLE